MFWKLADFPPFLNNKHFPSVGWRSRRAAVTLSLPGRRDISKEMFIWQSKNFLNSDNSKMQFEKLICNVEPCSGPSSLRTDKMHPSTTWREKQAILVVLSICYCFFELQSISKAVKRLLDSNVIDSQYMCNWGIASMIQMLRNGFQTFPMETRGPRNTLLFSQHWENAEVLKSFL